MALTENNNKEIFAQKSRGILRALHQAEEYVEASAIVSRDGLMVASLLSAESDADRFGAMCASLLALASKAATEVDRGELRQVILDGTKGPMLLTHIGKFAVLAVAARPAKTSLGKLIMETRAAAAKLAEIGNAL
ncbi:MAG: roadblock/LC7 domain-containing protein [Agitococcus sp.]|nr:roadblock/LC7 domain-containing protein [Agitococcus sp.]